jgi:hypothetical protein
VDWVHLAQDRVYSTNFEKVLIKLEVPKGHIPVSGQVTDFQQGVYCLKPVTDI